VSQGLSQRWRQAAPFAAAAYLPAVLVPMPGPRWDPVLLAIGLLLTTVVLAAGVFVPWRPTSRWPPLMGGVAYLGIVALLREAGGGNASGLGPLVLVPVIWFAMYRGRRELTVAIAGAALVYWVPIIVTSGDERYPASGWRIGMVFIAIAAILGYTIQRLHDQLRRQAEKLGDLAHTDTLTGLPNLRAWNASLRRGLRIAGRTGRPICLAALDVDDFKAINDREGHAGGDRLLTGATSAWLHVLRADDVLARVGGDEFAILLADCDAEHATALLDRLRLATTVTVSCSVGVAQWDGSESASSLLHRADGALYDAKHAGRDRTVAAA
jgi:diguanylate cyclase (GGDEF)-like protein